jgi:hypothetical protein
MYPTPSTGTAPPDDGHDPHKFEVTGIREGQEVEWLDEVSPTSSTRVSTCVTRRRLGQWATGVSLRKMRTSYGYTIIDRRDGNTDAAGLPARPGHQPKLLSPVAATAT